MFFRDVNFIETFSYLYPNLFGHVEEDVTFQRQSQPRSPFVSVADRPGALGVAVGSNIFVP